MKGKAKAVLSPFVQKLVNQAKARHLKYPVFEGDKVEIVAGKVDVGEQGKVIDINETKGTVTVEGINMVSTFSWFSRAVCKV